MDRIGLHRLELEVFAFHPRACQVYEKGGFVLEGIMRDALLWDDVFVDTQKMAILRTDPMPVAGTSAHHAPGIAASRAPRDL